MNAVAVGRRVALVVANPGVIDTRVVKYVTTLADAGYVVRVLCHSPDGQRHELEHAGGLFVQLPVPSPDGQHRPGRRQLARAGRGARRALDAAAGRLVPAPAGSGLGSPVRRAELAAYQRFPHVTGPLVAWRRCCRTSVAMTEALQRELSAFEPELVHQHDVHELNATAGWVARRRAAGQPVAFVYDAREYVIGQPNPPARQVAAYARMEAEFIGLADRVITVSEPIADQLRADYRLPRRPDVLVNATWAAAEQHAAPIAALPSIRQVTQLADDVPLLVYIGGLAPARGVHTVVSALASLPGVHLAVVSRAESSYTRRLRRLAADSGVAERFHLLPFVQPNQVVAYLSGCDLGTSPLLHAPNHDWALTNKFFEYLQAGLPIVTSDTQVQAELVNGLGIGTVFRAGDVADCALAVRAALADLPALRDAVRDPALRRRWSWGEQSRVLLGVYRDLLGGDPGGGLRD